MNAVTRLCAACLATNNLKRTRFMLRIYRINAPKILAISPYYCEFLAFSAINSLT